MKRMFWAPVGAFFVGLTTELSYYYLCHLSGWGKRRRATMRYLKSLDEAQRLGPWGKK